MTTYKGLDGLIQLAKLLENKKGVGKGKKTFIQFDMTMYGDIYNTHRALQRIIYLFTASGLFFESEVEKIMAKTEFEDNPDWIGGDKNG